MQPLTRCLSVSTLLLFGLLAVSAQARPAPSPFDSVHVRLLKSAIPRTIVVSGSKAVQVFSAEGSRPIADLAPGEKLTITTSGSRLFFTHGDEGGIYALRLVLNQPDGGHLTVELAEAQSKPTRNHVYTGALFAEVDPMRAATIKLVNRVAIEDYVASVLASEFNFDELEASKAMAVCIRTLAWRSLLVNGPAYEMPDHDIWQVYHGVSPITRTAREATAQTRGQVLTHAGELVQAVYHSSSGGYTANHEEVWDATVPLPYLRGKRDPFDAISPYSEWSAELPRRELLQALSEDNDIEVTGFRIEGRGRDNRVKAIELLHDAGPPVVIRSNAFRLTANRRFGRDKLRSTLFEVQTTDDAYVVSGKGFGHGVGLSQYGALEMSRRGHLYSEIVGYYYEGVSIEAPLASDDLVASSDIPALPSAASLPAEAAPAASRPRTAEPAAESVNTETQRPSRTRSTRRRIGW